MKAFENKKKTDNKIKDPANIILIQWENNQSLVKVILERKDREDSITYDCDERPDDLKLAKYFQGQANVDTGKWQDITIIFEDMTVLESGSCKVCCNGRNILFNIHFESKGNKRSLMKNI